MTWYFQNASIPYRNCSDHRSKYPTQKALHSRQRRRTGKQSSFEADDKEFENEKCKGTKPKDENDGGKSTSTRSQLGDECESSESGTIMTEKARIIYLKPLKAKIQSVKPSVDDQVTKPKVNQSDCNNPYRIPTSYQSRILQRDNRQPSQYQVIVYNQ